MSMVERHPVADPEAGIAACANLLAGRLAAACKAGAGRVSFMVSGGRTPRAVLERVAAAELPWDRIDVFASDERCVPADHPDSTENMVRAAFAAAGTALTYHGIGSSSDTGPALAHWQARLQRLTWPVAAGFLGIGEDGHIASLFPHRAEVLDREGVAFAVPETAPHAHPRLTLGPRALMQADLVTLIIAGAAKRRALAAALAPDTAPIETPAALLRQMPRVVVFTVQCPAA
ncbi:6-phosphogluconolactonase [Alterinioella nitratireducens]|uniref:6-phosphogluconolactonase n=1 Tax=Alterinioella nitratireducens TaxID=2735915 RepID=UPI001551B84C|nr:6-phosphogluconolactonase [Alterinioella nitratireducens]NPD21287.1 6-phosphogluconolactonase [Alterinioella nitratireducens]